MKHLDLFSGIGGFALATEWAWPDEEVEHIFCDNDPFAQAILEKHWPNSLIYGDIKELSADSIYEGLEGKAQGAQGWEEHLGQDGDSVRPGLEPSRRRIDLLTGGFPCQPFSAAGQRRGTEDDRHLWPEMLRVIRETNPRWVLGENVGGFLTWNGGLVFEQMCTDLEAEGYEVCPLVIPACAVGAPHRRDRVWIAAYSKDADDRGDTGEFSSEDELKAQKRQEERPTKSSRANNSDASDPTRVHVERRRKEAAGHNRKRSGEGSDQGRHQWHEDWPTVATRLCTLDDGLPNGLARPRGWRNAALKGAGNAIVPQVAAEILRAMRNI